MIDEAPEQEKGTKVKTKETKDMGMALLTETRPARRAFSQMQILSTQYTEDILLLSFHLTGRNLVFVSCCTCVSSPSGPLTARAPVWSVWC